MPDLMGIGSAEDYARVWCSGSAARLVQEAERIARLDKKNDPDKRPLYHEACMASVSRLAAAVSAITGESTDAITERIFNAVWDIT